MHDPAKPSQTEGERLHDSAFAEAAVQAEAKAVQQRYERRSAQLAAGSAGAAPTIDRYSFLQPDVWLSVQERQRAMLQLFHQLGWMRLDDRSVLEVGCGAGGNLLELLRLGFDPARLAGIELLPPRLAQARRSLPTAVQLWGGDAASAALSQVVPAGSQDIVLQSTVFSSLLDNDVQQRLADAMWRWVAPGGGVLWYDFTVDNPRNPDVRGLAVSQLRSLFPQARIRHQRVTLAPPLARQILRWHSSFYHLFNLLPSLRTHVLAWIEKSPS